MEVSRKNIKHKGKNVVLIVEDFDVIRNQIAWDLQKCGFEIISAGTGNDALVLMEKVQPQAVLIDGDMRYGDPLQTISLIHRAVPSIYIVLLTGKSNFNTEEMARFSGAERIIEKPFDASILGNMIGQEIIEQ